MNLYILNQNEEMIKVLSGSADNSACHFFNATMTKELNKISELTFEIDVNELEEDDVIVEENLVVVPDGDEFKLFIIREIVDVHGDDFIKEVYCEEAPIELGDEVILEEFEGKFEIENVLRAILTDTRWTVGTVVDKYIRTLTGGYKGISVLEGINTLVSAYSVEVKYTVGFAGNKITERKVHVQEAFGEALGKRFEYKKDVTEIKRAVTTGDIKTAVVPFATTTDEEGNEKVLTIENIVWTKPANTYNKPFGQTYIEDEEATAKWGYKGEGDNRRARWIAITFEEVEDENELIRLASLQLSRFTSPKVTYEVEAQDLYLLTGDEDYSFESVGLGDLVSIIDHEFKPALTLTSRVVKIECDLNEPSNSKITMGTIVESIVDKDLKTQLNELNYKVSSVASSVDLSGITNRVDDIEADISSGRWEAVQEVNELLFGETLGYHYMEAEQGIWVYDRPKDQNPTKAVVLKGGQIGLASYDSKLQRWTVGTFIDGNSVNASMITTGTLSADRIEAGTLTLNHLNLDVRGKINSIDEKASVTYVDTKVTAVAGEINLAVSTNYSTKSETAEAVDTAQTYADTKKEEAIATASSDATAKVNGVKTSLTPMIEAKASKTDVYTKTETYSKAQTDSAIKVAKDEINLGVSNTYETKTSVESKISTAVNNVQIGGKNMLLNSAVTDILSPWAGSHGSKLVRLTGSTAEVGLPEGATNCIKNSLVSGQVYGFATQELTLSLNTEYTASFWVYAPKETVGTVGVYVYYSNGGWQGITGASTSVRDRWTKVTVTFKTNATYPNTIIAVGVNKGQYGDFTYSALGKVEKGNKSTDWSPAVEDVQNSINSKANSTDVYTKSEIYTKTQTDSAIKVAKDEINLGVSSKVEESISNIQIGTKNLQRNSSFKTDLSKWAVGTGYARNTSKLYEGVNSVRFTRNNLFADSISYFYSGNNVIPLTAGETVTASANFYIDNVSTVDGAKAVLGVWFYNSSGGVVASSYTTIPFVAGKWIKHKHTATAPANTSYTAIVVGTHRNGDFYISKPMFEKGKIASDWSPAPEDLENSVYTKSETDAKISLNNESIVQTVKEGFTTISNHVVNGDASLGTDYWTLYKITLSDSMQFQADKVNNSFVIMGDASKDSLLYQEISVTIGTEYTFSMQVCNLLGFYMEDANISIKEYINSSWVDIYTYKEGMTSSVYKKIQHVFTAKSSKVRICFGADTKYGTMEYMFKDVKLEGISTFVTQSEIQQLKDSIKATVTKDDVKSVIEQNPESIKVGFNGINNTFEVTASEVHMRTSNGKNSLAFNNGSMNVYNPSTQSIIGKLGSSNWVGTSYYGLHMGLNEKSFVSWSLYNGSNYTPWLYCNFGANADKDRGIHVGKTMYYNGNILQDASIWESSLAWENVGGSIGRSLEHTSSRFRLVCASTDEGIQLGSRTSFSGTVNTSALFGYDGISFHKKLNMNGFAITNSKSIASAEYEVLDNYSMFATKTISLDSDGVEDETYQPATKKLTKTITNNTEWLGTGSTTNGKCKIELPTGIICSDYTVFLSTMGRNQVYLMEKDFEYFLVESDLDCDFEFMVKFKDEVAVAYRSWQEDSEGIVEEDDSEVIRPAEPEEIILPAEPEEPVEILIER